MTPLLDEMSINTSAVRDATLSAMVVVVDELARNPDAPHAAVYTLEGATATELGFFRFAIVGLDFCDPGLIALGEWGEVRIFADGGITEEQIDVARGPLRNLTCIDGMAVACGADLQVFRHAGPDNWIAFGPGDALLAEFPANHLEAIDGFSRTEIYAAGRAGVIWYYDGSDWTPVQTPTNLSYYAVHCGKDGTVYLSGQAGVLATGREDSFELVPAPVPLEDVWGIALYGEIIHMAGFRTMVLCDGEDFLPDSGAQALGGSFYDLHVTGDYMFSFGMKDVMRRDMQQWRRLDRCVVV
ncbi:hypothetical protein [Puniceibacterium confluentis]|uniref:hypothetical protein n=1 Tax=Puniceibacterium confluentis TaxID=1958944 RepID=UPI0011B3D774|nr:hypothetical protein [Puniceibacterium confluentis]